MVLIVVLAVAVGLMLAIAFYVSTHPEVLKTLQKQESSPQQFPYQIRGTLLTPAEIRFHQALVDAVASSKANVMIFAKVRVADVLAPGKGLNKSDWQRAFNKISAKHFDFVICDPQTLAVQAAIELDDKSHRQSHRVTRDNFLKQATESAGLPLLRFPVQSQYSGETIRSALAKVLKP